MVSSEKPERLDTARLRDEQNIWLATTRPDGRPHLTPIWFVYVDDRFYVCTSSKAVKARNVRANAKASVALESGSQPMIAEGDARVSEPALSAEASPPSSCASSTGISTASRNTTR